MHNGFTARFILKSTLSSFIQEALVCKVFLDWELRENHNYFIMVAQHRLLFPRPEFFFLFTFDLLLENSCAIGYGSTVSQNVFNVPVLLLLTIPCLPQGVLRLGLCHPGVWNTSYSSWQNQCNVTKSCHK